MGNHKGSPYGSDLTGKSKDKEGLETDKQISISIIENRMVFVLGGTFEMGDNFAEGNIDELPVHSVTVSDFNIGKYEVTQSEWVEYMPTDTYGNGVGDNYPAYYTSWRVFKKVDNVLSTS